MFLIQRISFFESQSNCIIPKSQVYTNLAQRGINISEQGRPLTSQRRCSLFTVSVCSSYLPVRMESRDGVVSARNGSGIDGQMRRRGRSVVPLSTLALLLYLLEPLLSLLLTHHILLLSWCIQTNKQTNNNNKQSDKPNNK